MGEVYPELKRIASRHLRREPKAATLGTTGLVHEAWLELARQRKTRWQGRGHFLALASTFMRRILLMRARTRRASKRGGDALLETLGRESQVAGREISHAEAILPALVYELELLDPFKATVVKLRVWHGLTVPECAESLGVSTATIDRHWSLACSWLHDALSP